MVCNHDCAAETPCRLLPLSMPHYQTPCCTTLFWATVLLVAALRAAVSRDDTCDIVLRLCSGRQCYETAASCGIVLSNGPIGCLQRMRPHTQVGATKPDAASRTDTQPHAHAQTYANRHAPIPCPKSPQETARHACLGTHNLTLVRFTAQTSVATTSPACRRIRDMTNQATPAPSLGRQASSFACTSMSGHAEHADPLSPPLIPGSDNQPVYAPAYVLRRSSAPPRAAPPIGRHHHSFRRCS